MNMEEQETIIKNRNTRKENRSLFLENETLKKENNELIKQLKDAKDCIEIYKKELLKLQVEKSNL